MKLEYTQTHCHFMKNGECVALETTNCINCKFGKTTKQYNKANDESIKRCREKACALHANTESINVI